MRDQLVKDPSALGLTFLELLDDFTLLLVFLWPFGGLHTGGGVPFVLGGELVARLGIGLVPLPFLYITPAVYAHAFSLLIDRPNEYVVT